LLEKVRDPAFQLTASLKTYLYSICRNLWLKKIRQQQTHRIPIKDYEQFLQLEDEEETLPKERWEKWLKEGLEKLGEPCKTLLVQFYYFKRSMQQLAGEMGYTNAANAKNQKYKCLQRLKKLVPNGLELP